ncbi:hypothetical protein [Streptomyces sp. SID13031]|uniref:hypothetical protein n=1 Tax=Streptomyces sp. SID13031 TaxID=2706046 RepID=UPI0013CCC0B9|nr:hypothetical protein [Streptomyces sp. SID13031]NEA35326.1 hypothetical protein [Streptomyces sp. SID13031]
MRRRFSAKLRGLIVVFAGAGALIGAVPAVAAAATPPTVSWAISSVDDLGIVQIGASAEAGIDGLTAHIRSYATGEEVAVVSSFSLVSGTTQNGVFNSDTRVHLDRFGSYQIDVDAVDTLGQRTSRQSVGTLSYVIQPIFSALSFDHTSINYSRRTVKVKGTVSGKWPTDGLLRPISRMPVRVGTTFEPFVDVQTSPAGRFTGEVTLDHEDNIYARFTGDSDYASAESQFQHISVQPSPTRFTVKVSPAQVKLGEPVTISGQLTWKSPDGWQPLANRRFGLLECDAPEQCPVIVDVPETDADGRFSVTSVPFATGYYQVGFAGYDENGQPDPFLAQVLSTAPVSVLQPAQFSDFTAARDESGLVVASGHLTFGNYTPVAIPAQIQYRAPGGASSWVTVANIENADWDGAGYAVSATVDQPAAGQWRAYYPGQAQQFQTAVSAKVQVAAAT